MDTNSSVKSCPAHLHRENNLLEETTTTTLTLQNIATAAKIVVERDLYAQNITVIQDIHFPLELPPKNIRFRVQKPIVTFTGREQFLVDLHKTVQESRGQTQQRITVLTQAIITATGGVGKTETMRMYIHQHGHEYDHVIWIDAEEHSVARGQFQNLATQLKIPREFDDKPKPFDLILKGVYEKLCQNAHSVLLIFDNAEALDNNNVDGSQGIREFLPGCLSPFFVEPTVLVTSRNQNWRFQNVIQLELWTPEECITFVLTQLKLEHTERNKNMALELGELFGRLPIAMQSAISVIIQETDENPALKNITEAVTVLINDYKAGFKEVLDRQPLNSSANITMISLWNISLKKILKSTHGELAIRILCTMAYLSPTAVPKIFLRTLFESPSINKSSLAQSLILLTNFSLITNNEKNFTMHRMIQDATIENLKTKIGVAAGQIFCDKTFCTENDVISELSDQLLDYIEDLTEKQTVALRETDVLGNFIHVTHHISNKKRIEEYSELAQSIAELMTSNLNYEKAIELYSKILETAETKFGADHENTLNAKSNLGAVLSRLGDYEGALKVLREILETKCQVLGPDHVETLESKHDIASVLSEMGEYKEALAIFIDVLESQDRIKSANQGAIYKFEFDVKQNISALYFCMGEYEKAEAFLQQRFNEQVKEESSTQESNKILTENNLASVMSQQGKNDEATLILEELMKEAEILLGPGHPTTVTVATTYADTLYKGQKNKEKAREIYENILKQQEPALGPEHPSTLKTKVKIADALSSGSGQEMATALEILEEVFQISSRKLGSQHPQTLHAKFIMGHVLVRQKKFGDAIKVYSEVTNGRETTLGQKHPKTLNAKRLLGWVYFEMEDYENSEKVARDLVNLAQGQDFELNRDINDIATNLLSKSLEKQVSVKS